ncbi:MAG: carbonic anhydrase [Verrucomicrobiales bacterium]|nr:carbonic anhydrase [Verrucomicrobiales bacterium]
MGIQTKESQSNLTPEDARKILIEGNWRFVHNLKLQRDLHEQVVATSHGQFPFAVVLSCIDSRVPTELIFDQGIGHLFCVRVAGNIVNEDVLGSMEYACKVAGSKIVVVLGHTQCGAVKAACEHVKMGNITKLLGKIQPAVDFIRKGEEQLEEAAMEEVAVQNVKLSIDRIRKESPILVEMESAGKIEIVGALYDVSSGVVRFFDQVKVKTSLV